MSYPPLHNGFYPPQYLPPPQQPPVQTPPAIVYDNASVHAGPYQYGNPHMYDQGVIPILSTSAQTPNSQQQRQPHPPPQQYVNPQVFQQFDLLAAPSTFIRGSPSQYVGTSTSSTSSNSPPAIPHLAATPTTTPAQIHGRFPEVAVHDAPPFTISQPQQQQEQQYRKQNQEPPSPCQQLPPKPSRLVRPPSDPRSGPQQSTPQPSTEMQKKLPQKPQTSKKQPQQQNSNTAAKQSEPSIDYQSLLLSLADEYLNAAHSRGTSVALSVQMEEIAEYHKLIATGLACLEAVLKNWRLPPRVEALVRLRYARILFEEADNDLEAETALSKGIDLCERNRMLDLKYSMQQLLAHMLYKTNPKASLKAVDGMISDMEAYRHTAWEYAFRLLRVSLSLSSSLHQDFVSALHHLHKISDLANRIGDKAVLTVCAAIEALAHLQHSSNSDAIEQAQRSVAAARKFQLNDELRNVPQLNTLLQMVDICCSLLECDVNQSAQKLKVMQDLMDEKLTDENWRPDGSFSIALYGKSVGPSSVDTCNILHVENGTLVLTFHWLPQADLYALCYFLSAVTLSSKNSYDGRKAEKFVQEGLRMIKGNCRTPEKIAESLANAMKRLEWRKILYCNLLLQQVFLACGRTDWDLALQTLTELQAAADDLGDQFPHTTRCLMDYITATIAQGTGNLDAALRAFQSPLLSLSSTMSKTARNDPIRDTAILAALNTILILKDPQHPSHDQLPKILTSVESFCKGSPNKYIQAAYYLVCATVQTESTIQTKQFLHQALQSATAISNSQITCMTLAFMSWKYFRGVVGEQAEKSARAGRAMAKRANDRLWVSVTDEMLADTLETQGKGDEARAVREEGQRVISNLPPALKKPG